MRILHVITSVNPADGGPIEGLTQFHRVLSGSGHINEVASLDDPEAAWVKASPLKVHALGPGRSSYAYAPRLVPWLRAHRGDYDAVIVRGLWQYGGLGTWRALHGTSTPYWVFPHGMLDPWFNKAYPRKHLKKRAYWSLEHRVLRDAQAVCFTCEEERLLARQSFRPYRIREQVVAYGTARPEGDAALQRAGFLDRFPELRAKKILLFLGRVHPKKGCDLLIEAFAALAPAHPDLHLVMVGPDQTGWKADLSAQAAALGVGSRLTWPGMLRGEEKWGALHAADAFVLPSHQENFGIAVAEAMACGVPVLISNKVNIWREIAADKAGLVADDTAEGTRQLLQEWLALPDADQQLMRQAAAAAFETRFEIHKTAQSLLAVLSKTRS